MTTHDQVPASASSTTAAAEVPVNPLGANPVYPATSTAAATTTATISPSSASSAAAIATTQHQDASGRQPAATSSASSELTGAKIKLTAALRHFPDFPIKGIDFVDIMPLFMNPDVHGTLIAALELQIKEGYSKQTPDIIVGLDARGFLFGPGLALRLGVGFAPVRKKGKLPGPCVTAAYEKEYGTDLFQMQQDAIKPGQKVLVVDDIIATGGSAKAAADLIKQLGGEVMGFLFVLEIPGLNGREKLDGVDTIILLEDA